MAHILFVQSGYYETLTFAYLSALLKSNGHRVGLAMGAGRKALVRETLAADADIIAVSCTTGFHKWYLDLAADLKAAGARGKIIFGGAHPTFYPDMIESAPIDMLCVGEGEGALLELAAAVDSGGDAGSIMNLVVKSGGGIRKNPVRPPIPDLDSLPFPDWDLYYARYPFLLRRRFSIITSRGCPFGCAFCFNPALRKIYPGSDFIRKRSVGNVLEEISAVTSKYNIATFQFHDDTFNMDKAWLLEFCGEYRRRFRQNIVCMMTAKLIDEEIVEALSSANCHYVYFSVECGNQRFRNETLKKNVSDEQIIKSAELLRKHGITFKTFNIVGLPYETVDMAFETIDLNVKIKTRFPFCSLLKPYPGTGLGELARQAGMFAGDYDDISRSMVGKDGASAPGYHRFVNIQRLFIYAVKFPFLRGAIRKLINFRPNFAFEILFFISYFWNYAKFEEIRPIDVLRIGIKNVRAFFG